MNYYWDFVVISCQLSAIILLLLMIAIMLWKGK